MPVLRGDRRIAASTRHDVLHRLPRAVVGREPYSGAHADLRSDRHEYPAHWEADVVLRDGGTARIRPITVDDAERLVSFYEQVSDESKYYRFFAPYPRLSAKDVHRFTHHDFVDRVGLAATVGGEFIATVRYDRIGADGMPASAPADEAEVAFLVQDAHQGRGVASALLEHIGAVARERGIRRFAAEVLPANTKMIKVFTDAGYTQKRSFEDGVVRLEFDLEPTDRSLAVQYAREHRAEARSVQRLLAPGSVAVIGVGRTPGGVGRSVLGNIRDAGFTGPPVRGEQGVPRGAEGARRGARPPLGAGHRRPGRPRGGRRTGRARPRGRHRVRRTRRAGAGRGLRRVRRERPRGARAAARTRPARAHVRHADHRAERLRHHQHLRRTCGSTPRSPPRCRARAGSACSPSPAPSASPCCPGCTGAAAASPGVTGVSTFVSSGNRADVSGNDVLQYWYEDPDTDVVLMYLESIGNPRKFTRLARRTAAAKPLVVVQGARHGGRSAGARRTGDPAAARHRVRAAAAGRRHPGRHHHRTGGRGPAARPPAAARRAPGGDPRQLRVARPADLRRVPRRGAAAASPAGPDHGGVARRTSTRRSRARWPTTRATRSSSPPSRRWGRARPADAALAEALRSAVGGRPGQAGPGRARGARRAGGGPVGRGEHRTAGRGGATPRPRAPAPGPPAAPAPPGQRPAADAPGTAPASSPPTPPPSAPSAPSPRPSPTPSGGATPPTPARCPSTRTSTRRAPPR